jgi:hypothetical protein
MPLRQCVLQTKARIKSNSQKRQNEDTGFVDVHLPFSQPSLFVLPLGFSFVIFNNNKTTGNSRRDFLWLVSTLDRVSIFVQFEYDCFWNVADEPCERVDPEGNSEGTLSARVRRILVPSEDLLLISNLLHKLQRPTNPMRLFVKFLHPSIHRVQFLFALLRARHLALLHDFRSADVAA